jgi:hypothetical protein
MHVPLQYLPYSIRTQEQFVLLFDIVHHTSTKLIVFQTRGGHHGVQWPAHTCFSVLDSEEFFSSVQTLLWEQKHLNRVANWNRHYSLGNYIDSGITIWYLRGNLTTRLLGRLTTAYVSPGCPKFPISSQPWILCPLTVLPYPILLRTKLKRNQPSLQMVSKFFVYYTIYACSRIKLKHQKSSTTIKVLLFPPPS